MDWSFIQKFTPMYVEAAWLTLVIGVLGIVLSIAIGLICAWVKYYKVPVARLGLHRWQIMRYIVLPQAASVSIPALAANVIFLLKETSVFSAVSLADLMYVAKDLIGMYYNTGEALTMLVAAYLVIILPISIVFSILERRVRRAGN